MAQLGLGVVRDCRQALRQFLVSVGGRRSSEREILARDFN
jgi:hypothetical protein